MRLYGLDINQENLKFFDHTIAQFSPTTKENGEVIMETPKQTCNYQGCTETSNDVSGSAIIRNFHATVDEQDTGSVWSEKCSMGQENCKIAPVSAHYLYIVYMLIFFILGSICS